jgi:hypothetical protein
VELLDWDRLASPDFVGRLVFPEPEMAEIVDSPTGWQNEVACRLETRAGGAVTGANGRESALALRFRVLDRLPEARAAGKGSTFLGGLVGSLRQAPSAKAAAAAPRARGGEGRRWLLVTAVKVDNLPKMDHFGSCDPYVEAALAGDARRTTVVRGAYAAEWPDEPLAFDAAAAAAAAAAAEPLVLTVMDWERVGAHDVVGRCTVPPAELAEAAARPVGWRSEPLEHTLEQPSAAGKAKPGVAAGPVVGRDGRETRLTVRLEVTDRLPVPGAAAAAAAGGAASGPMRALRVTVEKARNLPK